MKIRRCMSVYFEIRESSRFDMGSLLSGGAGLVTDRGWIALAPHLEQELRVSEAEMLACGRFSPERWTVLETEPDPVVLRLLESGLLVSDDQRHVGQGDADGRYRRLHWWPLAALVQRFARWDGVNSVESMQRLGTDSVAGLLNHCGLPPPATLERTAEGPDVGLQRHAPLALDGLLARRVTCRNYDPLMTMDKALFSRMMERVFAAQGLVEESEGVQFLKKHTPSGGGLHATECYLIVQRVEGISPGLYHYRPVDHALRPMGAPTIPLDEFASAILAGQHWFADAAVLVVYAPRIARSHWKYRNHPKAYRALLLDVGHLSQTLYVSATDLGLGAFVTSAINEVQLEQAFGLDSLEQAPVAIGGFGWRAAEQTVAEFDPVNAVW